MFEFYTFFLMGTKLIRLEDDTLIEVEVLSDQVQQISGGFADKVDATFDKIRPLLVKTCRPIAEAWKEINKEMNIESAEIELGLSFEAEGNLYVTKSTAGANVTVKLVLKPKTELQ
jgi:Trypsin-co-occurring domain 1